MSKHPDWQSDPRPLSACLTAMRHKHGWTRNDLAAQLCTPRSTLDGWLAGRACRHEAMVRLVMVLLDQEPIKSQPPALVYQPIEFVDLPENW